MENRIIFEVALMMIAGLLFGRLAKQFKLPNVTGYLVAGLLLGPSVLNVIPVAMVDGFTVVSDIALSFIAFSVGSEFRVSYFKKVGAAPIVIAIFESFGAIVLVILSCIFLGFDTKLSIMLGAIAAATAPAQTIMVIQQYKSKGALTSMLLSVVALDDAVALIGFGFASAFVNMMNSNSHTNPVLAILSPFYEVLISVIIGFLMALLMKFTCKFFHKISNRSCVILAYVLGTYYITTMLNGSALLACMAIGAFMTNIASDEMDSITDICDHLTPCIFMMFFVISGAGFEISALPSIGVIGVVYVIFRVIGKMLGAYAGGKLTHQPANICKWLGPTLMPQAGVALGLVVVAGQAVPDYAPQIKTVILCSTFIYSLIGPVAAKYALVKGGDIKIAPKAAKASSAK